jgi:Domain of unknown function (DUF3291)
VLLGPLASEQSKPFAEAIPETFGAAEQATGFVWRAPPTDRILDEAGKPKRIAYVAIPSFYEDPDRVVQTLSVWSDLPSAWNYVYRGTHLSALKQRVEWMEKPVRAQYVLWWASIGAMPTHTDGVKRLELLDQTGPTPEAFTFRQAFSSSGEPVALRG